MRWLGRWIRRLFRLAGALILVVLLVIAVLTQTPWGREQVLRQVLARIEGAVHGQLTVEGISSPSLLHGFTFRGVRILGEDGRPFLVADSLRAGISAARLLRGDIVFRGVEVWGPDVTLERLPGQEVFNVVAIFRPPDPDAVPPDSAALLRESPLGGVPPSGGSGPADSLSGDTIPRRVIELHGLRIHEGNLEVLLPLTPQQGASDRFLVTAGPDGRPSLRRMAFENLEAEFGRIGIRGPGQIGETLELVDLAMEVRVWRDPVAVTGARGSLTRTPGRLVASLESFRAPASMATGEVDVRWGGGGGIIVTVDGEADPLSMDDLRFIDDRLPSGLARGPFGLRLDDSGVALEFRETTLASSQGRIRARGVLRVGSALGFQDLSMDLAGVDLHILDSWMAEPLPLEARLDGPLSLKGDLAQLDVEGSLLVTSLDSTSVSTAEFSGLLHLRDSFSATTFEATLAPMEWGSLASLSSAMTLRGPGSVRLTLTGDLRSGLGIWAEATHVPTGMDPSRIRVEGWVRQDPDDLVLDLTGELLPLSLTTLRESFRSIPATGSYRGSLEVRGALSALDLATELETTAGPLAVTAQFDARHPRNDYSVDLTTTDFLLSSLLPTLPDPTRVTGRAVAEGRGFSLDSVQGRATVHLGRSEVGQIRVDTAAFSVDVEEGLLSLEDFLAETGVGRISGGGSFGLASRAPEGELTVRLEGGSIEALRPLVMGEVSQVVDELTPFQRDLLVAEGVDLDTLPTAAEVALGGRVEGSAVFRGGVSEFSGEGNLELEDLRYRTDFLRSGTVSFTAANLPGAESRVQATLATDSLAFRGLAFQSSDAELDLGRTGGRVRVSANRTDTEEYRGRGTFQLDSVGGGVVNLDELTLRFDTAQWNLGGPTSLSWSAEGYTVRDFQLIRPGTGNMRIRADGFLPLKGEGAFELSVERLDLSRVAHVAQMEMPLAGLVDFRGRVTGTPQRPRVDGSVMGEGLTVGEFSMHRLQSELHYLDERVEVDLSAADSTREVLALRGFVPSDLRLKPQGPRLPDAPVDLTVQVDSFPASLALSFLEALENVDGTLSGEIHFGGSPRDLEPDGQVALRNGAATLAALGVRPHQADATLTLTPDGTVRVEGSLRSRGLARISGTVDLRDVSDPGLALRIEATDFLSVARRDVQARLSGNLLVSKTYRTPKVQGSLTVEEGVLMVEEVARSAEVVDLTDPGFFDVVDTTMVTLRPLLRASQNPFLQNLQLDVAMSMARGSWLRGRELNVEMAGDLRVYWDRTERDLALTGTLQAIRGNYSFLGRQFQVQQGTVSFQGTPGINPNLDIQAVNRLRTFSGDRLGITASVTGTLLSPRVSLSSDAPFPIAESDLVSYIVFGRPAYALASGQSSLVQGAAGSLLGAATGATANIAMGTISNELGSVLARDVGLDYLAISQGQDAASLGSLDLYGTVATTQVEIGQYLTQDIFMALQWRPLTGLSGTAQSQFAGLRTEWRISDLWTLEVFIEDRFSNSSLFRAGSLGLQPDKVPGFLFYREWGY